MLVSAGALLNKLFGVTTYLKKLLNFYHLKISIFLIFIVSMNYVATFPKHRSINLNERQIVILLFTAQFILPIFLYFKLGQTQKRL